VELLKVQDLSIQYMTKEGAFLALDKVSISIQKGCSLGVVGESGCGKTTLGMGIMGLLPENASVCHGEILFEGRDILKFNQKEMRRYRWKDVSMIFQSAMNSLNPVKRVGDQIKEVILAHEPHMSKQELQDRVEALFRLVNLPVERLRDYPHQYSGGMRQRAVIAMALALNPKLVIADEATTALDVIIQDQILKETKILQRDFGLSILFISHDIAVVFDVSDDIAVMYAGQVVEIGRKHQILKNPAHPYTKALLSSYPKLGLEKERLRPIPGDPKKSLVYGNTCRFMDRCPEVDRQCKANPPQWIELEEGHKIFCKGTAHAIANS